MEGGMEEGVERKREGDGEERQEEREGESETEEREEGGRGKRKRWDMERWRGNGGRENGK